MRRTLVILSALAGAIALAGDGRPTPPGTYTPPPAAAAGLAQPPETPLPGRLFVGLGVLQPRRLAPDHTGHGALRGDLAAGIARPLALAAADLDSDGVPDLLAGYATPDGGVVAIHRGNVDALYPGDPGATRRRTRGTFTAEPFLSPAQVFRAGVRPVFLAAGDFDGDGLTDLVAAEPGDSGLHFLAGDGRGRLAPPERIVLPGRVTALTSGEINRRDGLVDLVVAVAGAPGAAALVFEAPGGALRGQPEVIPLPGEAAALALGALDDDPWRDLAVGVGRELRILPGRDRGLSVAPDRDPGPPPLVVAATLPSSIQALTAGEFVAGNGPCRELAVLSAEGEVHLLAAAEALEERGPGPRWEALATRRMASSPARWTLGTSRVSGGGLDELLVADPDGRRLHVVPSVPGRPLDGALTVDLAAGPLAVLPMRLNGDALDDLVVLTDDGGPPAVLESAPSSTFVVNSAGDGGDAIPGDGACAVGPPVCTLRAAIQEANASAGADAIHFGLNPGPVVILPMAPLPDVTDPLTIDGTTQPGFAGTPLVELNGENVSGSGLTLVAGGSTVRGLVINRFGGASCVAPECDGIRVVGMGNVVEGNYIGTDGPGSVALPNLGDGIEVLGSLNTIGGTAVGARNLFSGNAGNGIFINGAAAADTDVLGNYIGLRADGSGNVGNGLSGVRIMDAPSQTVGGAVAGSRNVISRNDDGIRITGVGAVGSVILGNHIGTNASGTLARANRLNGVAVVAGASGNTVGGTTAAARNVIAGNFEAGVLLTDSGTSGNLIQGNRIGTDLNGVAALANLTNGVEVTLDASNNVIGGMAPGAGNLISGNGEDGIQIITGPTGTEVYGNLIGTDAGGGAALANGDQGIHLVSGDGNTIGSTAAGGRNVISGNGSSGILIASADSNTVEGNYIGTDITGLLPVPNQSSFVGALRLTVLSQSNVIYANVISGNIGSGVTFHIGAENNTLEANIIGLNAPGTAVLPNSGHGVEVVDGPRNDIGTSAPGRNVISGNGGDGVHISSVDVFGTSVRDNHVGTDITGMVDLGNAGDGVRIADSGVNTIGGSVASGNLISGNGGNGITVTGLDGEQNEILGNLIGTNAVGDPVLGNDGHGIEVDGGPDNEVGDGLGSGVNLIGGNAGDGVRVTGADGNGNAILRNVIFANGGLGIDLGGDGVTANDFLDADGSPNNFQNFPVLSYYRIDPVITRLEGVLHSVPGTIFRVEMFASPTCDTSGHGEGGAFLGWANVLTNPLGDAVFSREFPSAVPAGVFVTATATDPDGNTSEFSPCDIPTVVDIVPARNALGVSVGTNVTLTFSEAVDPATINTVNIELAGPGGIPVAATVHLAPNARVVTLDPDPLPTGMLALGTLYVVRVSAVEDLDGNVGPFFTSSFVTQIAPTTGSPLPDVGDQTTLPPSSAPGPPPLESLAASLSNVTVGDNLGFSVAPAGDLDGDGIEDFLGGAPGYPVGGANEAGAAVVYLGSDQESRRVQPDIIFTGEAAHDRVGTAVAGNFDFDGDGTPDLLVGAEQVDRSQSPAVDSGAGRVYLIYFDPLEYDANDSGVPDYEPGFCSGNNGIECLGDDACTAASAGTCSEPGPPVEVKLGRVGDAAHEEGGISGAVFTGVASGDELGASLAAGGSLDPGGGDDIVLGAPGAGSDSGKVYVIFDDPSLSGTQSLGGFPTTPEGVLYQGSAGERLGASVALPGDVAGAEGGDLVLGAPLADAPGEADAGIVYIDEGGSLSGDTTIDVSTGMYLQIRGTQAGEQLGFSVAGGGDNRADGEPVLEGGDPDLLMGAPYYDSDGGLTVDTGRVVQTSGRLASGTLDADSVGDSGAAGPVDGIIWVGSAADDLLGWWVGPVGDVTGNGLDDISLGAPFANPGENDAGAVYLIEGTADAGLGGEVEVSQVGQTRSGTLFIGTQDDERAGLMMARAGDVSDDGSDDFTVGAPGYSTCTVGGNACFDSAQCVAGGTDTCADDAGTVHVVLDARPNPPGRCGPGGCTVVDLETGAQLQVPASSLALTLDLAVRGLVDPEAHTPSACDRRDFLNRTMVAVSDFDDDGVGLAPSLPGTLDLPTREEIEYQISEGQSVEVAYCDSGFGWVSVGNGTVKDNDYLDGRMAVTVDVDTLRLYAAFLPDADQDDAADGCDCDDGNASLWAPPGEIEDLQVQHDPATGVTTLFWTQPTFPGGTVVRYDALKSDDPSDFATSTSCLESDDSSDTAAVLSLDFPLTGSAHYYLVRAENDCTEDPACEPAPVLRTARACP